VIDGRRFTTVVRLGFSLTRIRQHDRSAHPTPARCHSPCPIIDNRLAKNSLSDPLVFHLEIV
jgi:hypothetical protein